MAACRRHDITEPSRETKSPLKEASALAMQLGASLGVIPRFASSHLRNSQSEQLMENIKPFTSLELMKKYLLISTLVVYFLLFVHLKL